MKFVIFSILLFAASVASAQSTPEQAKHDALTEEIHKAVYSGNTFRAVGALREEVEKQNEGTRATMTALLDTISQENTDLQAKIVNLEAENQIILHEDQSILNQAQDNGKQIVVVGKELDDVSLAQVASKEQCAEVELARVSDDVARQLRVNQYEPSLYFPKPKGQLDVARFLTTTASLSAASKGWRNRDVQYYMNKAEDQYLRENYQGALENYGKAYRLIEAGLAHRFSLGAYLRHLNHG